MAEDTVVAVQKRAGRQFTRALQHLPDIDVDGDPEALHQYRVALRKARTLLTLFAGPLIGTPAAALVVSLGQQARVANRARDLDVFVPAQPSGALKDHLARLRRQVHQSLQHDLSALERERALCEALFALPWPAGECPFDGAAQAADQTLEAAILAQGRRALDRGRARDWHRLRILVKRQRYLRSLCFEVEDQLEVKAWQDRLGAYNDLCCQRALLKPLARGGESTAASAAKLRQHLKRQGRAQKRALALALTASMAKKGAVEAKSEKSH
ncbi:CHAD domain-containing protein [Ferrimonas balearica]|uniref:CHAD domain-containing protein n=1 Tax=Ferrimonas balearica TaxID=44012 RepID=UPI001C9A08FC|nr:CHAD domain-containing protein [Ferrimonas balearica]MBY5992026.1 CHAD domain-containing protein [Ferrimonas balearica]